MVYCVFQTLTTGCFFDGLGLNLNGMRWATGGISVGAECESDNTGGGGIDSVVTPNNGMYRGTLGLDGE